MIFEFTEDRGDLRDMIRRFLGEKSTEQDVRRLMETGDGYDREVWAQMAGQLSLQGMVIPEAYGGEGFGWIELGIVLEEMGRALLCAPFFATVVLGATTLLESGDEAAKKTYLPKIADGTLIATVALTEDSGRWDEGGVTSVAEPDGSGFALTGVKQYVLDGTIADLVIVPARTAAGVSLFLVEKGAAGFTPSSLPTLDLTRKLAKLEFSGTPATLLGSEGGGWRVLSRVLDFAAVALAAEQVGGAQSALDMAVQYLKIRVAFGQVIGSFQGLKHMAADVAIDVESARSALYYALGAADADDDDLPAAASLAQAIASETFVTAAHQNIQLHGGIGLTWEYGAQLYFKRARASELFLGDAFHHRRQLAERIGV